MKAALIILAMMILTITACASPGIQDPGGQDAAPSASSASDTAAMEALPADNGWQYDAPENHGMNSDTLQGLHAALGDAQVYAAVTVKDGYIVDEYYKEGYDGTSLFRLNSATKSFTSALIGVAIDQGLIAGVDVTIAEYLPQIKELGEYWQRITIRQLLTHSSGINADDSLFMEWYRSDNWLEFTFNHGVVSEPGARFIYSTAGTHLLAAVLQQATGRKVSDYGREYLFEPLGMDSAAWGEDPQGITDGGNGLTLNVYDMAKLGQLFLNGGRWNEQQIISQAWVDESTSVQFARTERYSTYGYQWWIRKFGAKGYDTYFAQGHGGQLIFVVPELALVSVFTSNYPNNSGAPFPYFADYILAACSG